MKKPLLIFAALLSGLPAFAAVIAAGAGSYAVAVSPTSYGCVVDYGNWVTSAGVVQPAIAGCQPQADYNGVPVGTPVKLFPQFVGRAALEPTATHRWWGSIAFYGEGQVNDSGAGYVTADPMMARITNRGVRVLDIPSGLRADPTRLCAS